MSLHAHHEPASPAPPGGQRPRTPWLVRLLMFAVLGVGAYYIIAEHGAHLLAAWPLLILLACPLMHIFMHGGHGGHNQTQQRSEGGSQ
ncbi:DUF2933 domain-containing protein [Vitreimonas flagellata]|uniref:DUF2933 domain-containing protein n=1 Tax=Vitreimonas flagellata TaxID=2560861 RepID=UPI0010750D2F|nr:DUF2933 domain-containing protein [Vitreimonas flagellata]